MSSKNNLLPNTRRISVNILILLSCLLISSSSSSSEPRISEAGLYCGRSKAPAKAANYIPSFIKEMESLSELVTKHNWGTHSINSSNIPIYGLAQCFQHLSHTDCLLCYAASRTKLPRCLPSLSARIYLDGCFLRYDKYSFYSEDTDPQRDTLNCTSLFGFPVAHSERLELEKRVGRVVDSVVRDAIVDGGFGVGEFQGVYALAQCWNTLGSHKCRHCLMKAVRVVRGCLPNREGRALNAGCYLRYSTHQFYQQPPANNNRSSSLRRGVIVAAVLAIAALIMLAFSASYLLFTKLSNLRKENNINMSRRISSSITKSSLNYKYETLEKATDYFNSSRKIGEGGSGSVFKGILPNGNVVAVKRLVFNNRQWVDEFFNEVNLISGIEHKNLVKLLGCSIEGPESLLVYEYIPNNSLDQFIFVSEKISTLLSPPHILNWKERFNIIVGTAEGISYLHEGCKIRIIHRDIKSSNVLLDDNLSPKIADFGLARCLGADKTHLSTGIAGTLGYMAPEYLVRGQLTDKADVYSFGVLVVEIICGRRNNVFREDSASLLQTVWKLHRSNKLAEAVDSCLGHDFPEPEASRLFHIALLCTQTSASLRPSMLQVVQMLSYSNMELPIPTQPPFLNTSTSDSDTSVRSYSTNSFVSNALRKIGV